MAERIDHVAGAIRWIQNAIDAQSQRDIPNNEILASAYAQIAQTHATLALVEQQRIANLIGYVSAAYQNTNTVVSEAHKSWLEKEMGL